MIIDYSVARPPMAALKAAGVTAVGRYIGWDSVPGFSSIGKNLTKGEAEQLRKAGFQIFLAFEYAADAVKGGASQGKADGELATRQLHELGAPPSMAVYFAVDFDIPDFAPGSKDPRAKLGAAAHYFEAIRALKPAYKVGGYGGYWAVSRLLDAGLIDLAWQASAWSPRRKDGSVEWDPRAVLNQQLGTPLPGADLDTVRLNAVHGHDFGQMPRPPKPAHGVVTHVTGGELSLVAISRQHKTSPAVVLAETLAFHGKRIPANIAQYVDHGDLHAVMPQGLELRIRA